MFVNEISIKLSRKFSLLMFAFCEHHLLLLLDTKEPILIRYCSNSFFMLIIIIIIIMISLLTFKDTHAWSIKRKSSKELAHLQLSLTKRDKSIQHILRLKVVIRLVLCCFTTTYFFCILTICKTFQIA
jgi:hypothetical protein